MWSREGGGGGGDEHLKKRVRSPFNRKSTSDGMLITYSRVWWWWMADGEVRNFGKDVRAMGETIGQPKDRKYKTKTTEGCRWSQGSAEIGGRVLKAGLSFLTLFRRRNLWKTDDDDGGKFRPS